MLLSRERVASAGSALCPPQEPLGLPAPCTESLASTLNQPLLCGWGVAVPTSQDGRRKQDLVGRGAQHAPRFPTSAS